MADSDQRDALAQLWTGIYDISEELVAGPEEDSPLAAVTERVQINVRRVTLPWLGTHVLYVEEYPFDEPFELRAVCCCPSSPSAPPTAHCAFGSSRARLRAIPRH
jgi:hypothetical protein